MAICPVLAELREAVEAAGKSGRLPLDLYNRAVAVLDGRLNEDRFRIWTDIKAHFTERRRLRSLPPEPVTEDAP
ncbi:hypothetical protein [Siccirubricoccus phaeus]|uniref:hypothetical protein n=1 Tax=Siccirubricoccus phaeus TaxID=2595053 RepID=UPI0011F275FD|nr:hypothetical protein [Siccirubricoccus phaeus]